MRRDILKNLDALLNAGITLALSRAAVYRALVTS